MLVVAMTMVWMPIMYDKISMFALWLTWCRTCWCWKLTPQSSILAHMPSHHPSPDLLLLNTYDRIISHHDDHITFVFWSWLSWGLYDYLGQWPYTINITHYSSPDLLLHNIQNDLSRVQSLSSISKCSLSHHPSGTATTQDLELFIIIFPHFVILIIIAILALRWNYNHHGWTHLPAQNLLGLGEKPCYEEQPEKEDCVRCC